MDYAELPLPPVLKGWVAAVWTASVSLEGPRWIEQEAVPDGCIELIRRVRGRSVWRREQPPLFATGIASVPAKLRLGAGSQFVGVKLWPWAWQALDGRPCHEFVDDWIGVDDAGKLNELTTGTPRNVVDRLVEFFATREPPAYAAAILSALTVAGVCAASGMSARRLQRLFERDFGMAPRSYLRLLRFKDAFAGVAGQANLAAAAAELGYADQAHMARDFRHLAGLSPTAARARAKGPFV